MFVCNEEDCKNYHIQRLFCMLCNKDRPRPHNHGVDFIVDTGSDIENDWKDLRGKVDNTSRKAKTWYEAHSDLVGLLSAQLGGASVFKQDYIQLQELDFSLQNYYKAEVAGHEQSHNVLELQKRSERFNLF